MPASVDYDLLILGAGSGGLATAKRAAAWGLRVAIVEQTDVGGTCVNRGCIPKKLMVYAAELGRSQQLATAYGWQRSDSGLDWNRLITAIQQQVQQIRQSQQQELHQAGVELIPGHAAFVDPHQIQVQTDTDSRFLTATHLVIAVGGRPQLLEIPGIEHALTSRDLFQLDRLPSQLAIIGGGYIGVEFATILQALGSEVVLVEHNSQILSGFDADLCQTVQAGLQQNGIRVITGTSVKAIQSRGAAVENEAAESAAAPYSLLLSGEDQERLTANTVLCATGRSPNVEQLGLEAIGIELHKGAIGVDDHYRTTQPHIFAVGDCINRLPLTPVAIHEGRAVADWIAGRSAPAIDYRWVPSAVFAHPEAAAIGLTEAEARQKHGDRVQVDCVPLQPLRYRLAPSAPPCLIKIIWETDFQQVLGVHLVADQAAEIVQSLTPALRYGLTRSELQQTIGIHPTIGEEVYG